MKKVNLEFAEYELKNILYGLDQLLYKEFERCRWEKQPDGHFNYTPNKMVKQIRFTQRSIKRQVEQNEKRND